MFKLLKRLLLLPFTAKEPRIEIINTLTSREKQIAASLLDNAVSHKLFDCVMLDDCYDKLQQSVIDETDPSFDPVEDVGIILGSSKDTDPLGVPTYYVVGWFNENDPSTPILKNYTHFSLVPIMSPLEELTDRSKKLNTLFRSFFVKWLGLINKENSTEH